MALPPAIADASTSDRAVFHRRVALAPLCLCLVAGVHLYRVATADQTPWKGGGFGMFSTVDSESARYLRCYLVAADRTQLPLAIPASLSKRAAELRAAPSRHAAQQLAVRLTRRSWTQPTADSVAEARLILTEGLDRRLSNGELLASSGNDTDPRARLTPGLYLAAEAIEHPNQAQGGIEFSAVRVEVWKYAFDDAKCELSGRKLFEAVEPWTPSVAKGEQP